VIGLLLIIPVLLIRYGLPHFVDRSALKRLRFTPPPEGHEKIIFWVYLLSTLAILAYLVFTKIIIESTSIFYVGVSVYGVGILLYAVSMCQFGKPSEHGINTNGLYRFSRNPIYAAFFIILLGCVLITQSIILFALTVIYQISVHWVILSEERWCLSKFGDEYERYMKKVRRYL